MATATVTSKGQVTLPRDVRKDLGLCAGDRIDFIKMDDGHYSIMAKTGSIKSLKGIVPKPDRPVTLEEMEEAIVAGALRR